MSRRMDIELTSSRSDGSWTWRAAGALKPKGLVESSLLPPAVKVGDVLRVEVDMDLDGVWITNVLPTKTASAKQETLNLVTDNAQKGGVTVQLAAKSGRRPQRGEKGSPRRSDTGRDRPRQQRHSSGTQAERIDGQTDSGNGARSSFAARADRPARSNRPTNQSPARSERSSPRLTSPGLDGNAENGVAHKSGTARMQKPTRPPRPRPVKLTPINKHLEELYRQFSAEEILVAEKLASGGMPALRRALQEEKNLALQEGRSEFSETGILQIAERILSSVKEAVWRDKADAAILIMDHISLRDLRAVVSQAVPRDDEGRELLQKLRLALHERLEKLRNKWEADITSAIDENRTLQALRLSAKPPEPTAKLPAGLATRLGEAVSAAMTASISGERWMALLEAAVNSPIKRLIKPNGIPESPEVHKAAAKEIGRIPALAHLLGVTMPPPPGPPSIHRAEHKTKEHEPEAVKVEEPATEKDAIEKVEPEKTGTN